MRLQWTAAVLAGTCGLLLTQAWAAAPSPRPTPRPTMRVETWDLDGDLGIAKSPGVDVRRGIPPAYPEGHERPLPGPRAMDQVFEKAGLIEDISDWDQLERDILYRRARIYDLKQLESLYSKLSSKKLSELTRLIQLVERKAGGK